MKLIALFGPPGVGKSSLINLAKKKRIKSFDLEKLGKTRNERLRSVRKIIKENKNTNKNIIIGTADLETEDFPKDTILVLILPPKSKYLLRVTKRNKKEPVKKKQGAPNKIYHLFVDCQNRFDIIINKNLNIENTLKEILSKAQNF